LLRILWLSLDPYMRGRMFDTQSDVPTVSIGEILVRGTVSQVVASNRDGFIIAITTLASMRISSVRF
jgi:NADPH-dependent curcumin reductase CurA